MEAVIFVGIQASGKSTFFKERFFRSHVRINLDMLKTRHREKILLTACLEAKQPFVVDNTNPTAEDRKKYIDMAKVCGFSVAGYYFQSAIAEAMERNSRREGSERIPDAGVRSTHARMQLPTIAEGFDVLYYVSMGEDGQFIVKEWKEDEI